MSRQNSIQISKPRSLAFKIETDLTVVPISEYDDPELKRRKESLNRRVHQISRVGKAIRTEGWAAGTTARWITGITKGLDAIEIMVKWFVRGPFEDQLSVIFLVSRLNIRTVAPAASSGELNLDCDLIGRKSYRFARRDAGCC